MSAFSEARQEPPFKKPRHLKYWLRCLKTHLPNAYQSNDSQRLSLVFFILNSLDILDGLDGNLSREERTDYINWIYACQHPYGGFRGSPTSGQPAKADLEGSRGSVSLLDGYDSANLGSTFFALESLIILGDDLERVERRQCWDWVKCLQRDDGSFGEALTPSGTIEGGGDVRFCYLAAGVRWLLRQGHELDAELGHSAGDANQNREEQHVEDMLADYVLRSTVSLLQAPAEHMIC